MWIFRTDGSFITKHKSIRNPDKVAFLPGNTALINGKGDGAYHYISLDDGRLIWSSLKKGRRGSAVPRFAISQDGTTVYDLCRALDGDMYTFYVDKVCPKRQVHERYRVTGGLRVTHDIFCNEVGKLCALQSHILVNPEDSYVRQSPAVEQHGILEISLSQGSAAAHLVKQWQTSPLKSISDRACNGHQVLRSDFSVLDLDTMEIRYLLEDSTRRLLPNDSFGWLFDPERQLLTIYYLTEKINIVIDCQRHIVVAKYPREQSGVGYQGCPIGNEFWTGTSDGVVRLPFSNIDC